MRCAIRNKKKRVDMEAVDRRAFAATIAACEFICQNVERSDTETIAQAQTAAAMLAKLQERFPVKQPAAAAT